MHDGGGDPAAARVLADGSRPQRRRRHPAVRVDVAVVAQLAPKLAGQFAVEPAVEVAQRVANGQLRPNESTFRSSAQVNGIALNLT